jgi:hypothetical protein
VCTFVDGRRFQGAWKGNVKNGPGVLLAADGSVLQHGQWLGETFLGDAPVRAFNSISPSAVRGSPAAARSPLPSSTPSSAAVAQVPPAAVSAAAAAVRAAARAMKLRRTPGAVQHTVQDGTGKYKGELNEEQQPQGYGVLTYRNGDCAEGRWKDGELHGLGSYRWADDAEHYAGGWERGLRSDYGVARWPNSGKRYEGSWRNNHRHGPGVLYNSDGSIDKSGNWLGGAFLGSTPVRIVMPSATPANAASTALAAARAAHEAAALFAQEAPQTPDAAQHSPVLSMHSLSSYVGERVAGKPHGWGVLTLPDGARFHGQFEAGLMHGRGCHIFADGRTLTGTWKRNHTDGVAVLQYPDHSRYEGAICGTLAHGYGVLVWPDQRGRYIGTFEADKPCGFGMALRADGSLEAQGMWHDGQLVAAYDDDKGLKASRQRATSDAVESSASPPAIAVDGASAASSSSSSSHNGVGKLHEPADSDAAAMAMQKSDSIDEWATGPVVASPAARVGLLSLQE